MSDSYLTIAVIANDATFRARCAACAATQQAPDPKQWVNAHAWELAAQPGFAAAWDSAVANGIEHPAADPAVISDAQILAATQSLLGDK